MSEIKDITDTEFDKLLEQVQLGECDVVDLCINERQDMSEELLVIVLAPANDTLSTSGVRDCIHECTRAKGPLLFPTYWCGNCVN